jgi:hypothetical protein
MQNINTSWPGEEARGFVLTLESQRPRQVVESNELRHKGRDLICKQEAE